MKSLNVVESLLQNRNWINYSPGRSFNLYNQDKATEKQIYDELTILYKAGFRGLSCYGFFNGLENIPKIAKEIGFEKVISLLWWSNDELYQLEKDNLKSNIQYIDSLLIGNEAIHKGATDFNRLKNEIATLKNLYQIPVTTGLHRFEYNLSSQLALELGDYIMCNLQTWWANIRRDPIDGAGWVKATYEEILKNPFLPANKAVIVHEATWPCGDNIPEGISKEQSYENQRIFYEKLLEYNIPFIWSFSTDMNFAKIKSPPGGYGGLWTDDWQPKPALGILSKIK
jgi:exo-beta-1,3-glucanase (GH17 family)